jgi:hypothetical protein
VLGSAQCDDDNKRKKFACLHPLMNGSNRRQHRPLRRRMWQPHLRCKSRKSANDIVFHLHLIAGRRAEWHSCNGAHPQPASISEDSPLAWNTLFIVDRSDRQPLTRQPVAHSLWIQLLPYHKPERDIRNVRIRHLLTTLVPCFFASSSVCIASDMSPPPS